MKYDVAIIGAGLCGMSLAVALAGAGRRVAVVDAREARSPAPPEADAAFDSRIYAVGPASADWLGRSRVWGSLDAARVTPVYDMQVFGDDSRTNVPGLSLSAYRAGIAELCTIIEERELARVLESAARFAQGLDILRPAAARQLRFDSALAGIELHDGRQIEADLIVGADGSGSWARAQAGIAVDAIDYFQTAIVANFDCEKPHRNRATQWFRREDDGSSGILAYLPLPDNRVSIVWSVATAQALGLMALDAESFAFKAAQAGMHALGSLVPVGPRASFALRNQRAQRLVAPRFALVGDAAHVLHPLAGQGLNLGFSDCALLFTSLAGARDCGDFAVLRSYERARKAAMVDMHALTHGLARLFASAHPLPSGLRNIGLNLVGRLPVLQQLLVRNATRG